MFRLDKSKFSEGKQDQQSNSVDYWMSKTPLERLEASWYLTCCAYGIDINNPPRLDKTVFSYRKRK